jgi:hypothetical protein
MRTNETLQTVVLILRIVVLATSIIAIISCTILM